MKMVESVEDLINLKKIAEGGKAVAEKLLSNKCPVCGQEMLGPYSCCDCKKCLLQEH